MFVAQITFEPLDGETTEAQYNEINKFLGALRMDGRVLGKELLLIKNDNNYNSIVPIPAQDAFKQLTENKFLEKDLNKFAELGLKEPSFQVLGEDNSENLACECKNSAAFILFTNYILIQSPLRCADCFMPVPLYRIPRFKSNEYYEIISWQSDYKSCDSLQMNCKTGEKFALREMLQLDSSLTKQGLEICAEIKKLTGKDCYYYLYKYYGKSDKKERERKCPVCNGEWLLKESWHDLFDFKCDKDYLLSNIAVSLK